MSYLVFIISLCAIVLVHELGHYLVARCFNVAVDVFSIGFGPAIWSKVSTKTNTEFRLSPILLGGYVKFSESLEIKGQQLLMTNLALWRQILILLAGPFANLLLAFFGLVMFFKIGAYTLVPYIAVNQPNSYASELGFQTGQKIVAVNQIPVSTWEQVLKQIDLAGPNIQLMLENPNSSERFKLNLQHLESQLFFEKLGIKPLTPEIPSIIGQVQIDSAASKAGLKSGDKIIAIDNQQISKMQQVSEYVRLHPNQQILLTYERDNRIYRIKFFTDRVYENKKPYGRLGISSPSFDHFPQWFIYHQDSWYEAISKTFTSIHQFLGVQFKVWFHLNDQMSEISGPIGMARAANEAWTVGLKMFLIYWVWLNIGLAVVNLMPIPILDGGQCLLLILRSIFPKILTEERQKLILLWSLIFIVGLFVMGLFNDLSI